MPTERDCSVVYGFGKVSVGLIHNLPVSLVLAEHAYADFVVDREPEVVIDCFYGRVPELGLSEDNLLYQSSSLWSVYMGGNHKKIIALRTHGADLPYSCSILDDDFRSGVIYREAPAVDRSEIAYVPSCFEYPLAPIILICVASNGSGLMVHSCGVDDRGKGYLFVGTSQAGKTTTANLWKNHGRVLNDDRVFLYREGDLFKISGLPWHGEFLSVSPDPVILSKIFFLNKSARNRAYLIDRSAGSTLLFQQSSVLIWDPGAIQASLALIDDLLTAVPAYVFGTVPNESAVDFARCVE